MTTPTPLQTTLHRWRLLDQRSFLEDAIGGARTVGDVWRLSDLLDRVEQRLAAGPDAEPKSRPEPLDAETLVRLRGAVGLLESGDQSWPE